MAGRASGLGAAAADGGRAECRPIDRLSTSDRPAPVGAHTVRISVAREPCSVGVTTASVEHASLTDSAADSVTGGPGRRLGRWRAVVSGGRFTVGVDTPSDRAARSELAATFARAAVLVAGADIKTLAVTSYFIGLGACFRNALATDAGEPRLVALTTIARAPLRSRGTITRRLGRNASPGRRGRGTRSAPTLRGWRLPRGNARCTRTDGSGAGGFGRRRPATGRVCARVSGTSYCRGRTTRSRAPIRSVVASAGSERGESQYIRPSVRWNVRHGARVGCHVGGDTATETRRVRPRGFVASTEFAR